MQVSCRCLNVVINTKGNTIEDYVASSNAKLDHLFFKDNLGSAELESIHKEQSALVAVESCGGGQWLVHLCLNCKLYTHALDKASTAVVLVNRNMLTNQDEIDALKKSEKFSPVFHIVIDSPDEDLNAPIPGVRGVAGSAALHQQLTEWVQRQSAATEERVRQFSEQQYAALEQLRARAHRDHLALSRTLVEASSVQKLPTSQFTTSPSVTNLAKLSSPQKPMPVLPDPTKAIAKRPAQMGNRPRNVARKPSVDAEGLFDLDGMDELGQEPFVSDGEIELSDTDESGSHDEGIHIPRLVSSSLYAKSLPVNVPIFGQHSGSLESPHRHEYRVPQDPMDIAASIKALAKSVHGDAVFGDLPRPRFSSQI